MKGALIEAAARQWLGTPWVHQARVKGEGVDCAGVVIEVAKQLGFANGYDDKTDYSRIPDEKMQLLLAKHMKRVTWNERQQGDVVHIAWRKLPQHLGILTSKDTIIHAYETAGVVETEIGGPMGVRGVYRFR